MYTEEFKKKTVAFAKAHNITAAAKQFNVSAATVSAWANGKVRNPYPRKKPAVIGANLATEGQLAFLKAENTRLKCLLADTLLKQVPRF